MTADIDTSDLEKPISGQQQQEMPGKTSEMTPRPNQGEESYEGSGKLEGRAAIITGGDSGIGRAVAIAFAREGADVLIAYLSEDDDAQETARWVEEAGRKAVLVPGDICEEAHCRQIVEKAMEEFGRVDILVNNAAHQATINDIKDLTAEELDLTFRTNIYSQFFLAKAALAHMEDGACIINTTSIQSTDPSPELSRLCLDEGRDLELHRRSRQDGG